MYKVQFDSYSIKILYRLLYISCGIRLKHSTEICEKEHLTVYK